jgi:hypothetical protein
MLLLLVGTLALSILWFAIGCQFLSTVSRHHQADSVSVEWTMLLGAFVLAVVSQAVHFVLPLPSTGSAMVVAALFVLLAWGRRLDLRWLFGETCGAARRHVPLTIVFLAVVLLIALTAARPCKIEDTENYHAQVLRWTESASLVPGLALVHGRLGFNSLWFPLEAVLSFAFLSNGPLPMVNTATFVIGALYLLRTSMAHEGSRLLGNLALAAIVPYFAAGFLYAGSQSPDLPVLTYGLLTFFAACHALESRRHEHYLLAICLAVASVCWKLSALPLLVFVPLLAYDFAVSSSERLDRGWLWPGTFLAASGAILLARSVVLSGYLFFPSTMLDVFPVEWKAPSLAHGQAIGIRAFARGFHKEEPIEALTYPMSRWIPIWIRNWNNTARVCLTLLAVGAVWFVASWLFRASRQWFVEGNRRALLATMMVSVLGTAFWFWEAPDVRFGASYLTALIAVFYLPWLWLLDRRPRVRRFVAAAVVVVAVGGVGENLLLVSPIPPWCSTEYAQAHPNRFYWLAPAPYPTATFVDEPLSDGSINHVVTSGGLAHYGPVPNSPLPIAGLAVHRGPRLSDGYRLDTSQ